MADVIYLAAEDRDGEEPVDLDSCKRRYRVADVEDWGYGWGGEARRYYLMQDGRWILHQFIWRNGGQPGSDDGHYYRRVEPFDVAADFIRNGLQLPGALDQFTPSPGDEVEQPRLEGKSIMLGSIVLRVFDKEDSDERRLIERFQDAGWKKELFINHKEFNHAKIKSTCDRFSAACRAASGEQSPLLQLGYEKRETETKVTWDIGLRDSIRSRRRIRSSSAPYS